MINEINNLNYKVDNPSMQRQIIFFSHVKTF